MKTKRFIKAFGLSAVALLGLSACGSVVAKPEDYNDKLITVTNYQNDIYHNIQSVVYDSIHSQGVGKDVLDQILYLYAISEFGPYDQTVTAGGVTVGLGEVTLSQAAASTENLNNFVRAHKAYWDADRTDATAPASESEKNRVEAKLAAVNDRIAVKMYNKISGGSYSDRHIFSEKRFLQDLRKNLASVQDPETAGTEKLSLCQILPDVEPKDVFKKELLHLSNYQDEANTYIVDEIVPEIYRELLNELYVNDNNYNALGRSYARKVNIIEIKHNTNYPNAAYYLASALVSEINAAPSEYEIVDLLQRFKDYSSAAISPVGSVEIEILNKAGGFTGKVDVRDGIGSYYLGTEYGDLASKYVKMLDTVGEVDTATESSFTNSGAYPTYVGLDQQRKALQEKDYVNSGWFIKNGGLTDLPSEIRSRLFNIAVANGVKESKEDRQDAERQYDATNKVWKEAENENAYVCRINGHNYLKTASRIKGESIDRDILHYDSSSKSYYIVEIEEAVSSSKLSRDSRNNYATTREDGQKVMENIINSVNELVAAGESYSSLATKKYLEALDIQYHDQSVYDYFKTNYPDLFE